MPKAFMCPYFKKHKRATKHSPDRVICEGGTIRFRDDQMRQDLIYKFCALEYEQCQIYQTLTRYHERKNIKQRE